MQVRLFTKQGDICYSTSRKEFLSERETYLISRGWRYAGLLTGVDISSNNISTMSEIIKMEKEYLKSVDGNPNSKIIVKKREV
ncbi:hypothetical protein LCGC14_2393430 [marine sediment metagenome]|uniref:Uncharacterized protein n=1 Tax=marine sediment metagenome TaxID=412755 RepID=A0A0F9ERY1_9ZZZZ